MKHIFAFIITIVLTIGVFAQGKTITHKVEKGETITQIAQKYNVSANAIYQLNPDAQTGLKPNSILIIPSVSALKAVVNPDKVIIHEVLPKETLYGIEKKYNISDQALKQANSFLEQDGLQIGQKLTIPVNGVAKNPIEKSEKVEKAIYHYVLPKETKYAIAKQYGITIQELELRNPEVVANLPEGFKLLIKGKEIPNNVTTAEVKKETPVLDLIKKPVTTNYAIKPKETLYGLSKMFEISQSELIAMNPFLADGVVEGMVIKVPVAVVKTVEVKKEYVDLTKKSSSDKKKLAFLLPFNIARIEGDTINSMAMRLKKDKFLNMTLDFYAGALMAIDSAKALGLKLDIAIFDSQETKNSSAVATIIEDNKLQDSDVVIGPFYQSNVEKTAQLLTANQVAVISPLSKDQGVSYQNIFQSIPSADAVKNAVFTYMRTKNGNMIAVVDRKKGSVIQYIQENQKDVKFSTLTANGGVSAENLKSLFVKDRINYVIMETGNTQMIKATINTMLGAMATFNVQLVILEPNETLDTAEISMVNLAKLKLMYPSVSRENESLEALLFVKEFKKRNKVAPNDFATRGFDVTFDTMMRLSQDKNFYETIENAATEQVDNKFEYYKIENGGYANKGIYILYYDTDLTIKEAK